MVSIVSQRNTQDSFLEFSVNIEQLVSLFLWICCSFIISNMNVKGEQAVVGELYSFLLPSYRRCCGCWMLLQVWYFSVLHEFYIFYIILVLILLRADLAVGYDLAPLASSAVGAFKSLAAALRAKLGLWAVASTKKNINPGFWPNNQPSPSWIPTVTVLFFKMDWIVWSQWLETTIKKLVSCVSNVPWFA